MQRIVNEYEIESIFHLAAQTIVSTANRSPLSTFEANIKGTWCVLEAGAHLRHPAAGDRRLVRQGIRRSAHAPLHRRKPAEWPASLRRQQGLRRYPGSFLSSNVRPAGLRDPLRQLFRRRRFKHVAASARYDPRGIARRASDHSLRRHVFTRLFLRQGRRLQRIYTWRNDWRGSPSWPVTPSISPRKRRSRFCNWSRRILQLLGSDLTPDVPTKPPTKLSTSICRPKKHARFSAGSRNTIWTKLLGETIAWYRGHFAKANQSPAPFQSLMPRAQPHNFYVTAQRTRSDHRRQWICRRRPRAEINRRRSRSASAFRPPANLWRLADLRASFAIHRGDLLNLDAIRTRRRTIAPPRHLPSGRSWSCTVSNKPLCHSCHEFSRRRQSAGGTRRLRFPGAGECWQFLRIRPSCRTDSRS